MQSPSHQPISARRHLHRVLWGVALTVAGCALDPQPEVHLSIDRRAKYDYAATVLFAVQRGGLKKIGFVDPSASL